MRLLLDSHAFIWYADDSTRLSTTARNTIKDPANEIWVSAVSAWEIAIKVGIGKLKLPVSFDELFPGRLHSLGFRFLPFELMHIKEMLKLPLHHGDPFDRLLIAQVRVEGMSFVSCDPHAAAYGVPLIW